MCFYFGTFYSLNLFLITKPFFLTKIYKRVKDLSFIFQKLSFIIKNEKSRKFVTNNPVFDYISTTDFSVSSKISLFNPKF